MNELKYLTCIHCVLVEKTYARRQIESDRCPENILYKPSDEGEAHWQISDTFTK